MNDLITTVMAMVMVAIASANVYYIRGIDRGWDEGKKCLLEILNGYDDASIVRIVRHMGNKLKDGDENEVD